MPYDKVGGFWKKVNRNGKPFLSGKILKPIPKGTYLFVFTNDDRKKGETSESGGAYPDYNIFAQTD